LRIRRNSNVIHPLRELPVQPGSQTGEFCRAVDGITTCIITFTSRYSLSTTCGVKYRGFAVQWMARWRKREVDQRESGRCDQGCRQRALLPTCSAAHALNDVCYDRPPTLDGEPTSSCAGTLAQLCGTYHMVEKDGERAQRKDMLLRARGCGTVSHSDGKEHRKGACCSRGCGALH
jgi:hypothetical protein